MQFHTEKCPAAAAPARKLSALGERVRGAVCPVLQGTSCWPRTATIALIALPCDASCRAVDIDALRWPGTTRRYPRTARTQKRGSTPPGRRRSHDSAPVARSNSSGHQEKVTGHRLQSTRAAINPFSISRDAQSISQEFTIPPSAGRVRRARGRNQDRARRRNAVAAQDVRLATALTPDVDLYARNGSNPANCSMPRLDDLQAT